MQNCTILIIYRISAYKMFYTLALKLSLEMVLKRLTQLLVIGNSLLSIILP